MPYRVGQDVDAWCTRCRLDTTHVIVALDATGDAPKRVECTSCGGQHNYRAPKTPKPPVRSGEVAPTARRVLAAAAAARAVAQATASAKPAGSKLPEPEPVAAPKPVAAAKPRRAASKPASSKPSAAAAASKVRDYARRLEEADVTRARAYSMRDTYVIGDLVEHPRFGLGFVIDIVDPAKCGVLFDDGRKILVMGHRPAEA